MRFWIKRRSRLIHDYSLVGYILSPNPIIMGHSIETTSLEIDNAVERLITKLILDQNKVGTARAQE